jgi:hypothetical protein
LLQLRKIKDMSTLHLEIVTPEARIYQAEVEAVVVPGVEGELGILPHHVALMTQIAPGDELGMVETDKATMSFDCKSYYGTSFFFTPSHSLFFKKISLDMYK